MKLSPSVFAAVIGLSSLMPISASAQNYAGSVISSSNLSSGILYGTDILAYNDPTAVLGQPTTLDNEISDTYHASMVQGAYGLDETSGKNLLVNFDSSGTGQLTVQMSAPITHTGTTWFNQDFIVFSNGFFPGLSGYASEGTDMSTYQIGSGATYGTLPQVSVSADGVTFYTVNPSSSLEYPENPYHWDGLTADPTTAGWGALNDFTKPVDPSLTAADFAGQTVAYADNTLYNGSAGGTSYSFFGQTPLTTIDYIRFSANATGPGGVVDAVVAVGTAAAVPEASTFWSLLLGLLGFAMYAIRRNIRSVFR